MKKFKLHEILLIIASGRAPFEITETLENTGIHSFRYIVKFAINYNCFVINMSSVKIY